MEPALGLIEIRSWSAGMAALDAAEKAATIKLLQLELNDLMGVVIKFTGSVANVNAATGAARMIAEEMRVEHVVHTISAPDPRAASVVNAPPESSPLIEQEVVFLPNTKQQQESPVADQPSYAIGMIETQGFAAIIEAIDSACKAANVEVIGKEKTGGGYVTVLIKGDVGAVKAAIAAGKEKVGPLGKLIAAHVIARPSAAVMSILPKS